MVSASHASSNRPLYTRSIQLPKVLTRNQHWKKFKDLTSATLSGLPRSWMRLSRVLGGKALPKTSTFARSSFLIDLQRSTAWLDNAVKLEKAGALAEWCNLFKWPARVIQSIISFLLQKILFVSVNHGTITRARWKKDNFELDKKLSYCDGIWSSGSKKSRERQALTISMQLLGSNRFLLKIFQ